MTGATVIRGALGIVTGLPGAAGRTTGDIRIVDGRIAAIGEGVGAPGDAIIDARHC